MAAARRAPGRATAKWPLSASAARTQRRVHAAGKSDGRYKLERAQPGQLVALHASRNDPVERGGSNFRGERVRNDRVARVVAGNEGEIEDIALVAGASRRDIADSHASRAHSTRGVTCSRGTKPTVSIRGLRSLRMLHPPAGPESVRAYTSSSTVC